MPSKYNPFTKKPDYVNFPKSVADILSSLAGMASDVESAVDYFNTKTRTTNSLTYYISPTGNDITGDGLSPETAWATWDKALSCVPEYIEHRVRIKAAAGTYTSFPRHLRHKIGRLGLFSLEGMDDPTVVAGPFTIASATKVGKDADYPAGWDIVVTGAGWDIDEWYGKFIKFTSGDVQGIYTAIGYNTTDTISINSPMFEPASTNTFLVVDPSVRIETEFAPVFSIRGDGCNARGFSQFVMANLEFYVPDMSFDDFLHWYPYTFNENCNALMGVVRFTGINAFLGVWNQEAGMINLQPWEYFYPWTPILEDDRLVVYYDPDFLYWGVVGSVQVIGTESAPDSVCCWVSLTGHNSTERGVQISNMVCRNEISIDSLRAEASSCTFGHVSIDHASRFAMGQCRYRAGGFTACDGVRVDDCSMADFDGCWVDSATANGILVTDGSSSIILNTGGTKANITSYGLKIGAICRVKKEGTTDLEGTAGKVRLDQNNTTVNWPSAKAGSNDTLGSFITA